MSDALRDYQERPACRRPQRARRKDSPEEDDVLDEMDVAWLRMTREERDTLDRGELDGPRVD